MFHVFMSSVSPSMRTRCLLQERLPGISWHKRSLGLEDELIRIWWSKVKHVSGRSSKILNPNDEVMTFYIRKVKGQLPCDVIMSCRNTFLAVIQQLNSEQKADRDHVSHLVTF